MADVELVLVLLEEADISSVDIEMTVVAAET
jgi:hypothetical protein